MKPTRAYPIECVCGAIYGVGMEAEEGTEVAIFCPVCRTPQVESYLEVFERQLLRSMCGEA